VFGAPALLKSRIVVSVERVDKRTGVVSAEALFKPMVVVPVTGAGGWTGEIGVAVLFELVNRRTGVLIAAVVLFKQTPVSFEGVGGRSGVLRAAVLSKREGEGGEGDTNECRKGEGMLRKGEGRIPDIEAAANFLRTSERGVIGGDGDAVGLANLVTRLFFCWVGASSLSFGTGTLRTPITCSECAEEPGPGLFPSLRTLT
jgi:hypothetical protein